MATKETVRKTVTSAIDLPKNKKIKEARDLRRGFRKQEEYVLPIK